MASNSKSPIREISGFDDEQFTDNPKSSSTTNTENYRSRGVEEDEAFALEWLKEHCNDDHQEQASEDKKADTTDGKLSWNENSIHVIDEKEGITSLHVACSRRAPLKIIAILLNCLDEETINATDWNNQTALHFAIWNGASIDLISALVDRMDTKSFNRKDKDGENALHYAFQYDSSIEIICLLIQKAGSAQTSVRNLTGKLPFELYNRQTTSRKRHLKKLLEMHTYLDENDQAYHVGLFKHILLLPSEDQPKFMDFTYLRNALNRQIIKPFSLGILFLDLAVQILVMVTFSFNMMSEEKLSSMDNVFLGLSLGWLIVRELSQLPGTTMTAYISEVSNHVDLLQLGLIITILGQSTTGTLIQKNLLVPCIGISWIQLIFVSANLFYTVAVFVAALISISLSLFPFAFVVSIISAAFAHMYRALGAPDNISCTDPDTYTDGGWACNLRDAYFQSFVMTLDGGFAFLERPMGLSSTISMLFAFIMGIVLLNMLIALVSDVFAATRDQSESEFWISRLRIVDELESIGGIVSKCMGKEVTSVVEDNVKQEMPSRISLNDWWNENREEWKDYGTNHRDAILWYCNIVRDNRETPGFIARVSAFLDMSLWSEIFSLSKAFRKFIVGCSYDEDIQGTQKKALGWIGSCVIVFVLSLKLIIALPLGFLTAGYLWERELKAMFFGKVNNENDDDEDSSHESVVESDLREQIEDQKNALDSLHLQMAEMKSTLAEQNMLLKQLLRQRP